MTAYVTYLLGIAFEFAILFLLARYGIYQRNPVFTLWVLTGLIGNLAIILLYWAGERELFIRLQYRLDILWIALLAVGALHALLAWRDPIQQEIFKSAVAFALFAVVARMAASESIIGIVPPSLNQALNFVFLPPAAYLVWKLSGLKLDGLGAKLLDPDIGERLTHAAGYSRSLLG